MSMILGREHNKNRPFCADDNTSAKIVQIFQYFAQTSKKKLFYLILFVYLQQIIINL